MNWKIVSLESIKGGTMRYLKPLRPFFAWSQLSIPTVYDDSLSYYEVLNKCIFHFNEMLKTMQENYEIIDEAFAKILEECEAAIARCEEAAARAEAAQSAAEKAQAAAEAAQAAAEAAQKLAEAAQAAAEAARDDAVTAQKAAEAAQAAAEAAQAAAEAAQAAAEAAQQKAETAQQKAETAQAAAEAAQAKAEDAQEKTESARDAAQAAQRAAEAAQTEAEAAQAAAESARDAAQTAAESAREAAQAAQAAAEEIKNALDNYYNKTESDAAFVKKAGDTMTGNLTMSNNAELIGNASTSNTWKYSTTKAQDLNDLKTGGIYRINGNTILNSPAKKLLDVIVLTSYGSNIYTQIAISTTYDTETYLRVGNNEGFGKWFKFSTTNNLNNYLPLSGGTMTGKINVTDELNDTFTGLSKGNYVTPISENSDLNNVKSNCVNFYHSVAATSEESKNFPAKISGFLVTLARDSLTYTRQIYYATLTNNIYTRIYNSSSNSWSNWGKIVTTAEINNSLSGYLPLTGGTMTGNITMSNNSYLVGNSNYIHNNVINNFIGESNYDLNMLLTSGYYESKASTTYLNKPTVDYTNSFVIDVNIVQAVENLYFGYQMIKPLNSGYGVYYRSINRDKTWNSWVRLDNVPDTNTVKFYQVKETDHLRFITYDLGNYYKVEGYTKIQLAWRIPKTIESNPVVGTVYKYSTFTDFDEIKGTDPYTMSSDNHINVCPGLDYFRPNGFTSGTSAGNMLSNIVFNDTAGNFYFEIQITWPDNEVWDYIGDHYNVLINENSLIGTLIVSK